MVALNSNDASHNQTNFYFLKETLKRLKPAANIQVECRCLQNNYGTVGSFLHYARSIGADLLMTKKGTVNQATLHQKEIGFSNL